MTTQAPPLLQSRDALGRGATVTKMFQSSQVFKTKDCISEASSGKTAHLKKVPMKTFV